jgi:hypothetical protein
MGRRPEPASNDQRASVTCARHCADCADRISPSAGAGRSGGRAGAAAAGPGAAAPRPAARTGHGQQPLEAADPLQHGAAGSVQQGDKQLRAVWPLPTRRIAAEQGRQFLLDP